MKNLEKKHLMAYLPYDLQYKEIPILRPLSDLFKKADDKHIEIINECIIDNYRDLLLEKFEDTPAEEYIYEYLDKMLFDRVLELPYVVVQKLLEWHFDVFNLIDSGFAFNINEL